MMTTLSKSIKRNHTVEKEQETTMITMKNAITLRSLNISLYLMGLDKMINLWKACPTFNH
jgi:hypothetical protein